VAIDELVTEPGVVVHPESGRRAAYSELAAIAADLSPSAETPDLKTPDAFRLIGKEFGPKATMEVVTGRATYGSDVRRPGMRYSVIARCPFFGGTLLEFDDTEARKVAGVVAVVEVPGPPADGYYTTMAPGVAVVATSTWAALKGREALEIRWDPGPFRDETTASLDAACQAALDRGNGQVVRDVGDFDAAVAGAARTITRRYRLPYVHHATLEPQNCFAHVREDGCEVIGPTQMPAAASRLVAQLTGLDRLAIDVQMTRLGGGFGRGRCCRCLRLGLHRRGFFGGRRVGFENHQRGADGDDVARFARELDDLSRHRRRQFYSRLIGHHRADHVFLVDLVADRDEPLGDLGFDRALTEVRELEDVLAHSISIMLRMPAIMRFLPGKYCHSNACG